MFSQVFYDDFHNINFDFKYLTDEFGMFQFNCSGYVIGDTAIIREIDFALNNGADDFLEIRGTKNIEFWFTALNAQSVLDKALIAKNGFGIAEVKI